MKELTRVNVEQVRSRKLSGPWVASAVEHGYLVKCGESVLVTVNGARPRIFRNLDTLAKKLKEEIGVTEFSVVTEETA